MELALGVVSKLWGDHGDDKLQPFDLIWPKSCFCFAKRSQVRDPCRPTREPFRDASARGVRPAGSGDLRGEKRGKSGLFGGRRGGQPDGRGACRAKRRRGWREGQAG